tara:strand:- start:603 stop:785 length:183 start_codon:yes stop_codon:yes gene_type:complete
MQPRLNPSSRNNQPLIKVLIKILIVVFLGVLAFYFVEKIDFPSPQKEIKEDVTNQIEKLK